MPYKIMVVDDEPANLRLLERLFRRDYEVLTASGGVEALRLLAQHDVALLITDQRMPGMTGIELLKHTARVRPHMVRIILTGYTDVTSLVEALNCGHVYKYVTKPWNNEELRMTAARALEHYEVTKASHELTHANRRLTMQLREMSRGFVRAIADALEAKDEYIHGHARRASGYASAIGRRLGLDAVSLEQLSLAAFLHDIGKIGTPEQVLLKPSALDAKERAQVELHSERGARMLAGIPEMSDIASAVRHHHEHWDGTGYPEGLRGEQIPLHSRIILVADAYDAITSPRPFRRAADHDTALRMLEESSGQHFDPEVVRAFCALDTLTQIRRRIAPEAWGAQLSAGAFTLDEHQLTLEELRRETLSAPVLAACVLSQANADFNLPPTANLHEASLRLGESRLRALVSRIGFEEHDAYNAAESWQHALRTAAAARLLAQQTSLLDAEDAYTLGLLHDVGESLFRALFPSEWEACAGMDEGARLEEEITTFGVDHAQVSQWVLDSCGLPRTLTSIVQTHHDAMRSNTPAALLLHVADCIAHADEAYKVSALDPLGSDRLALLGLSRQDLARIHADTAAFVEPYLAAVH